MKFDMVAATHTGRVRTHNEDSLKIVPELNLAAIADGMGGHKAGDIASAMAVSRFCRHFEEQSANAENFDSEKARKIIKDTIPRVNNELYSHAQKVPQCEGMGTTLVVAAFHPDSIHIGHIGDSRLYRLSDGTLSQVTIDHTLGMEMLTEYPDQHVPAYLNNVLRKALGIEANCQPDYLDLTPAANEVYLLCSDGLSNMVPHEVITPVLSAHAHQLERCAEILIDMTLKNGAPDNVSIILISSREA